MSPKPSPIKVFRSLISWVEYVTSNHTIAVFERSWPDLIGDYFLPPTVFGCNYGVIFLDGGRIEREGIRKLFRELEDRLHDVA